MSMTKESAITAGLPANSAPTICCATLVARRGDAPLRPNGPLLATTTLSPKEPALRAADAAARPPPMTRTLQASSAGLTAAMTLYLELPASRPAVAPRGRGAGGVARNTASATAPALPLIAPVLSRCAPQVAAAGEEDARCGVWHGGGQRR